MTGRRRIAATLALLIAVGVIVVVLRADPSPPSPATAAGSGSATATVQRRDLVQTDTEPGTLGHADPQTVYNRLGGTITWLPSVGQVIRPGGTLFRVAGQPVILMNGTTPAYRELGPSDGDAQDVLQLNRNLSALGFNTAGIVIDDMWQAATTTGVDELQASLGEAETGTLTLGQVVFLPGDRLISSVSVQLGSQAALRIVPFAAARFVSLTTTGTMSGTETTTQTGTATTQERPTPHAPRASPHAPQPSALAPLLALLRAETAQLKAAQAQLRAAHTQTPQAPGSTPPADSTGGSATPVLATTSVRPVVTVQLDPSRQREATVGEHVTVQLPSGRRVRGTISAVSSIAQSPRSVPVTIALRGSASGNGLDQASVSVTFAAARARRALAVPVTALLAMQGGRFALQEAAPPHRLIPVTPGLFAAGYVKISGARIHPGLVVSDSQG